VDDLLQEIAMALWTALPRFRGDSSERTWLYRVAHNTAISFRANRRRRISHEQPAVEWKSNSNPETDAMAHEQSRQLWVAVQQLPLSDRQITVLYLEGMTAAEIEAVTGLSSGNVATRLTRIRQRLAARLRGEEVHG
jgi:RNA polymerase sigma-70 factor (ECF subfamily)